MDRRIVTIIAVVVVVALLSCCCCGSAGLFFYGRGAQGSVKAIKGDDDPGELITLQLALEEMVWTNQRAKALTAQALSTDVDDVSQSEWASDYEDAMLAWEDARAAAGAFEALADAVPPREDPDPQASLMTAPDLSAFDLGPEQAAAAEETPLDLSAYRSSADGEVTLDATKEAKQVIQDNARGAAIVSTYNQAPSGEKLKAIAGYFEGDAREAKDFMGDNYQGLAEAYKRDDVFYTRAWRTATAIEAGADVALFVGDLATGGGKVALTKSVSKRMLKRLLSPPRLGRNLARTWRAQSFTTAVNGADLILGLYNKGVVVATGDEAATFSVTNDVSSGISMLLTVGSLRGQAGLLKNAAELAANPASWKAAWGWGTLTGKIAQAGVNGATVDVSGDRMIIGPAPVSFTEDADAPDPAALADTESMKAVDELAAAEAAYEKARQDSPSATEEEPVEPGNPFAGSYEGDTSISLTSGNAQLMPTTMEVAEDGSFTLKIDYSGSGSGWSVDWMSKLVWKTTVTGTIAEDGSATGTGSRSTTTIAADGNSPPTNTSDVSLTGTVSGDAFTGSLKMGSWQSSAPRIKLRRR